MGYCVMIGVEWLSWLIQDTRCSSLCLAVDLVELIESRTPSTVHLCIAIGVESRTPSTVHLCIAIGVESRTPSTVHLCIAIDVDWVKNTKYSTSLHCCWCWLSQEHQVQYIFALLLVLIDSRTPSTVHLCIVIGVDWFKNTKYSTSLHCYWCMWLSWLISKHQEQKIFAL